jgi:hypothetical protein
MGKNLISSLLMLWTVLLFSSSAMSTPTTISDNYWGSDAHGFEDVIASTSDIPKFNISSATIDVIGSKLYVDIKTGFAGLGDNKLFSAYTYDGNGIGYGDLFLSSSWNPVGTAPYLSDNNINGTIWKYGFALDNRYSVTGGIGTLYSLNANNNNVNTLLSEDFIKNPTYRNGQEVAVDKNSNVTSIRQGTWSVDDANDIIRFVIDISGTSLITGDKIAFHWGETCANDVIEGSVPNAPVPEPATMLLFGSGLVGLAGFGKRKLLKK